jgi:hypothetical protein
MKVQLKATYLVFSVIGFFAVLLGTLNKGFFAKYLYQESVTFRGDYWRAGQNMTLDNPIFGVGLDNYGSWYRKARTLEATLRRGPDVVSNAAHNVFLDFSSNGGLPLLLIYLALVFFVLRAIVRIIKLEPTFNPLIFGLVGAWIAYMAQSIISLNQLGLAIWGWIISGLIVGYAIHLSILQTTDALSPGKSKGRVARLNSRSKLPQKSITLTILAGLLGIAIISPALITSSKVKDAFETTSAEQIFDSAFLWPRSSAVQAQVALVLSENKLDELALKVLNQGILDAPDNFLMWRILSSVKSISPERLDEANKKMKTLDPNNPNL